MALCEARDIDGDSGKSLEGGGFGKESGDEIEGKSPGGESLSRKVKRRRRSSGSSKSLRVLWKMDVSCEVIWGEYWA